MLRRLSRRESDDGPEQPVLDVLQRLWQTKMSSIALIERWLAETPDTEIRTGLSGQIVDERRHLTLIGEQIRRLGGKFALSAHRDALGRIFGEAQGAGSDVQRLIALHRAVKAFTIDRCSHLIPMVDATLAGVMERIARDEERHIRWADVRLQRLLTHEKMRECNLLLGRSRDTLELLWGRSWKQFTTAFGRKESA